MHMLKSFPSLALVALTLFSSCASSVKITSSPSGVDVYADGFYVGQTPMRHKDAKPTGTTLSLKLEKEGYDTFETEITKDARLNVKALLGSMFIVPLGWILAYPKARHFVLKSNANEPFSMDADRDGTMVEVKSTSAVGSAIFVVATENEPCSGRGDASTLEASLGIRLMKDYDVLERRNLSVLTLEQTRQLTGLHDESTIVEAGKLSGAKGVVLVSRFCDGQRNTITNARFVDCETGALHWAAVSKNQSIDQVAAEIRAALKR